MFVFIDANRSKSTKNPNFTKINKKTEIGEKFAPFLEQIKPFLTAGLSGSLGFEVCNVSIGVVGDLFRSLGKVNIPLSDRDAFIENLLKILAVFLNKFFL